MQLLCRLVTYRVHMYPRTISRIIIQPSDFLLFYAFVLPLISAFSQPSILCNAEIHFPLLNKHFYKIQNLSRPWHPGHTRLACMPAAGTLQCQRRAYFCEDEFNMAPSSDEGCLTAEISLMYSLVVSRFLRSFHRLHWETPVYRQDS
jgi:hypothetical protein